MEQASARGNSINAATVQVPSWIKQDLLDCLAHWTSGTPDVARESQPSGAKTVNELEQQQEQEEQICKLTSSERSQKKKAAKEGHKNAENHSFLLANIDVNKEALSLQAKLETCCKQSEYGAIKDLEQEVFEKYLRFRRAAPEVAIIIMQNLAALAHNHGEKLRRTGDLLEAIKAYELNLQSGRNVDGDDVAKTSWPYEERLFEQYLSTKAIYECYRQLGLQDQAKCYIHKLVDVIKETVRRTGAPKDGRTKPSLFQELGQCHTIIADLSSDATERDESLEQALCALTEAESLAAAEVAQASAEELSGTAVVPRMLANDLANDMGSCLYARAFLQYALDEDGHVVRPAAGLLHATELRLKANVDAAKQQGLSHYAMTALWQQAKLTFMMSSDVASDIQAVSLLILWCWMKSSNAYASCGCCDKLRGEPDASKVSSEERTRRDDLAKSLGLPFARCFSDNDTLVPMSACSGCMLVRSESSLVNSVVFLIVFLCVVPLLRAHTRAYALSPRPQHPSHMTHTYSHACATSDRYCSSSCEAKAWEGEKKEGFISAIVDSHPAHKLTCPLIKDLAELLTKDSAGRSTTDKAVASAEIVVLR